MDLDHNWHNWIFNPFNASEVSLAFLVWVTLPLMMKDLQNKVSRQHGAFYTIFCRKLQVLQSEHVSEALAGKTNV